MIIINIIIELIYAGPKLLENVPEIKLQPVTLDFKNLS